MFMAPFNTHFLVAEKIWPAVRAMAALPVRDKKILYGQFCFGCVAVDVDKIWPGLSQRDTHFFDRSGDYEAMASRRSAAFIRRQADFLCRPFADLSPQAQAFGLGYLCHLCVDEVSKHLWRRDTWQRFRGVRPGAAFSALDEAVQQHIQDYPAIVEALCALQVIDVIPTIPRAGLERMQQGVCAFAQAKTVEAAYLVLVDWFSQPTPEQRRQKQQSFRAQIELARPQIRFFRLETLIEASLSHSLSRLTDLIENRTPKPGYPVLDGS